MTIHADVVKDVSGPLHTLINNGIQESTSRVGVLGGADVDTFTALCEHRHTGSYTTPGRATSDASDKTEGKNQPQMTSDVISKNSQPSSFASSLSGRPDTKRPSQFPILVHQRPARYKAKRPESCH